MNPRRVVLAAALLAVVASAAVADATCKCGDVGGCVTHTCAGFSPGDSCTPPLAGSCKIVKGSAEDATCCCRCKKPKPPSTGTSIKSCADHYADVESKFSWLPMKLAPCDE